MFILEQTAGVQRLQTGKIQIARGNRGMHRIPSTERISELKKEVAALVRLNALYNVDSRRSGVTLQANACRRLRLMEIREELKAMKRPGE